MDFSITSRGNEVAADINDRQARGIVTAHKIQRLADGVAAASGQRMKPFEMMARA